MKKKIILIIAKSQWMATTANDALRAKTTAERQEVIDSKKILTGTLVIAFIIIIYSLYFIKSITEPVAELLSATRKIKSGKLQYRIEEKLRDEFGELGASFNEMAMSLEEQYVKLQETENYVRSVIDCCRQFKDYYGG